MVCDYKAKEIRYIAENCSNDSEYILAKGIVLSSGYVERY